MVEDDGVEPILVALAELAHGYGFVDQPVKWPLIRHGPLGRRLPYRFDAPGSRPPEVEGLRIALEAIVQDLEESGILLGFRNRTLASKLARAALGLSGTDLSTTKASPEPRLNLTQRQHALAQELGVAPGTVAQRQGAALRLVAEALVRNADHPSALDARLLPGNHGSATPPPDNAQPVTLLRLVSTYALHGRTVKYAITERLIRAEVDGLDHYDVRARTPTGAPESDVLIRPLLNCRAEPDSMRRIRDETGVRYVLSVKAPHALKKGETWYMATQVVHQEGANDLPLVGVTVTSHGITGGALTLRIQYQVGSLPDAVWWYADCLDDERWVRPPAGAKERLEGQITQCGFLEWTYPEFCKPRSKYGIAWEWPA